MKCESLGKVVTASFREPSVVGGLGEGASRLWKLQKFELDKLVIE